MSSKIFIAGITGFLGSRTAKILHAHGYEVYGMVRSGSQTDHVQKYIRETLTADLLIQEDLSRIKQFLLKHEIFQLIFAVGSVNYHHDYETARKHNVQTALNFMQLAEELHTQRKLHKIVGVGSVAARGFMLSKPAPAQYLTESVSHFQPTRSIYCDIKYEIQQLMTVYCQRSLLPLVMVEPGSLVGPPTGRATSTNVGLVEKILKGFPVLAGGVSYASVERVAEGVMLALEKGRIGETYILGGENLTMTAFAKLIRQLQHERVSPDKHSLPVLTIPRVAALILGKLKLVINPQQAVMGSAFHFVNDTKARQELGYHHDHEDLIQALQEMLAVDGP
ncbi:MAG: NAD-dependent epimerase/dehydratase family protein [SAR324 cluster bacterium]|nr:NAD-dependent epimerase/dehydratase family protein [SAR324 cluster bacterium]